MNKLIQATALVASTALAVPLWAVPAQAQAQSATETASSTAYFFSGGTFQPEGAPAAPPNIPSQSGLDFVGEGNLGVAAAGGQEDKVSFVFFSLTALPFEATITKATLTMKLAPESNDDRRVNAKPEQVRACAPDDSGFGGQDGENLSQKAPERKCDVFSADALPSSTEAQYVYDVSALAASWPDANDGIALTKSEESDPAFQVVFTPDAVLEVEFTAPPEADLTGTEGDALVIDDPVGFGDSGDVALDGGFSGDTGSADVGGFDDAVAAPLTGAELPAEALPETAVDEPAVAAETRAAPAAVLEQMRPTAGFWLAALTLAAGLAFLSLVMGDPRTAAAGASSRPSRLSQALSSGQGGSTLLGPRSV